MDVSEKDARRARLHLEEEAAREALLSAQAEATAALQRIVELTKDRPRLAFLAFSGDEAAREELAGLHFELAALEKLREDAALAYYYAVAGNSEKEQVAEPQHGEVVGG